MITEIVGNTLYITSSSKIRVGVVAVNNKPVEIASVWIAIPGGLEILTRIALIIEESCR